MNATIVMKHGYIKDLFPIAGNAEERALNTEDRKERMIEWKQQERETECEKIRSAALYTPCHPSSFLLSWCSVDSQERMKQAM